MDIFPAIDLRGGQVVRLRQGDPSAQTTFSDQPAQIARQWAAQGARWLHVVNLDGALGEGGSKNWEALYAILQASHVPVQFGGGLREPADVERVLHSGVARVVLGTMAIQQPQWVADAIAQFGADKIVVGLDARAGLVATHGWQTQSAMSAVEVATRMGTMGVQRIIFTDIARDGLLQGVNVEATRVLATESGVRVIASGGVASLDDVRRLHAVAAVGIEGVIIGQALYTGAVNLREAIALAARG